MPEEAHTKETALDSIYKFEKSVPCLMSPLLLQWKSKGECPPNRNDFYKSAVQTSHSTLALQFPWRTHFPLWIQQLSIRWKPYLERRRDPLAVKRVWLWVNSTQLLSWIALFYLLSWTGCWNIRCSGKERTWECLFHAIHNQKVKTVAETKCSKKPKRAGVPGWLIG